MRSNLALNPTLTPLFETPREQDCRLDLDFGYLPDFVRGVYYLNGPARFAHEGVRYRHWLDGDGMVCSLRLDEKGAHFCSRFVKTAKWQAEAEAGRRLFRTFGTTFGGARLQAGIGLASPANVSVFPVDDKLLAFGEQGMPYELDPDTLETRGEFNFNGALNAISPFSAHPKFDAQRGELFNFGISFSPNAPTLNLYRFDRSLSLIKRTRHRLDAPRSVHDFGLSDRYAVFYLSPYMLLVRDLLETDATLMEALHWTPELTSQLLVLSRETGEEVARVPLGRSRALRHQRFSLHISSCFDRGGKLFLDTVEYARPLYEEYHDLPNLFCTVGPGRPVRLEIDLGRQKVRDRTEIASDFAPDFPAVAPPENGQPVRHGWMLAVSNPGCSGNKFFDQLVRLDWTSGHVADVAQAPKGVFMGGEPAFVPHPEQPERGVIMCQVYDVEARRSAFAIFDAFALSRGPLAELNLPYPSHFCFHSSFAPLDGERFG